MLRGAILVGALVLLGAAQPANAAVLEGGWGDGTQSLFYNSSTGAFGFDPVNYEQVYWYAFYVDNRYFDPGFVDLRDWDWPNYPDGWANPMTLDLGAQTYVEDSSEYSLTLAGGHSLGNVFNKNLTKEDLLANVTFQYQETPGGAVRDGDFVYIVPEPASLVLLGILAAARLRRR
jgi:hypothetical protein